MANLLLSSIAPGYAGLNTDTAPDNLPLGAAPVHENFLTNRDGILPIRGPLVNHDALNIGTNQIVAGTWVWNNKLLVSLVTQSASATREPWTAPYRKAAAAADLALGATTMKYVDLDNLTVSNVAAAAASVIGGRGARLGAYTYGFAYGVNTGTNPAVLENGGYLHRRRILRWDGTTAVPTVYANAPEGGQDVRTHLNRLFVLGGRDVPSGLTPIEQNTLFFSDQYGPTADTANMWQDDVSGLTNKIVVDSDDANDFGVGLAKVGENLVIFKRRSIHILYGYSSTTFQVRTVSSDIGCIDRRSLVEYEDGCYFLSDQGYMWFDGDQLTNVSDNLHTSLAVAGAATVGDNGVDGGRASAVKLSNDYVLLSIQKQAFTTGIQATDSSQFSALLHTPTGTWSRFSSNATASTTPVHMTRTLIQPVLIDGNRVVKCDKLPTPELAAEADRGYDKVGGASPTSAEIPAKWWSGLYPLSSWPHYSQLHRVGLDYTFVVNDEADGAEDGWYVSFVDGTGTVLVPEYQVPSVGDPTGFVFRRRDVRDAFPEAGECQIRVEWRGAGNPLALVKAEIYGAVVEFQRGRQRRSS